MRNEEPDNRPATCFQSVFVVGLNDFAGCLLIAKFLRLSSELIVEHVRQPLEENQWKDEILELRRVRGPANGASRVPKPRLQQRNIKMFAIQGRHWERRCAVRLSLLS